MSPDYRQDKAWADAYISHMKEIVGLHIVSEAPELEDARHNTDLIVLGMSAVRVACRLRSHEYLAPYGHEFTIRSDRPSGADTELLKVVSGFGDFLLYGFASADEPGRMCAWTLGDLSVFRRWWSQRLASMGAGQCPGRELSNRDGSSSFRVFRFDELPADFVVAQCAATRQLELAA